MLNQIKAKRIETLKDHVEQMKLQRMLEAKRLVAHELEADMKRDVIRSLTTLINRDEETIALLEAK